MSAAYYPQVQKIYVAYYGRPADPAGLQYWAGQLAANGGNLTSIINAFGNSAESTALYAGASDSAKVTAIYQQLFNRAPDSAGLAFYTAELTAGRMTAASIALNVANGAQGTDATYLANKVTVGTAFTDALTVDSAAAVAYTGTTAITAARSLITGTTTSAATTNVASTITSIKSGGGAAAGQTFTLTNSTTVADVPALTSGNDTVNAPSNGTLQTIDIIIDRSITDSDVLNATNNLATVAPRIQNVETLNISGQYASTGLALTSVSGSQTLNLATGVTGGTASVTDASTLNAAAIVAGASIGTLNVTATASGTRDTVMVDAGSASTVAITGGAGTDSFEVTVASGAKLTLATASTDVDTYTINTDGGTLTLDGTATALSVAIENGSNALAVTLTDNQTIVGTGKSSTWIVNSASAVDLIVADDGAATSIADFEGIALQSTGSGTVTVEIRDTASTTVANLTEVKANVIEFSKDSTDKVLANVWEGAEVLLSGDLTLDDVATLGVDDGDPTTTAWTAGEGTLDIAIADDQTVSKLTTAASVGVLLLEARPDEAADTKNGDAITIASLDTQTGTKTETVVVTGAADLRITTWAADATASVLSASSMTGDLTIGAVDKASTIETGSGDDSITSTAAVNFTVTTNNGADTVSLTGNGTNTISTGAGNDTVTAGTGNDTITLGTGADRHTVTKGKDTVNLGSDSDVDTITYALGTSDGTTDTTTLSNFTVGTDVLILTGKAGDKSVNLSTFTQTDSAYTLDTGDVVTLSGVTTKDLSGSVRLGTSAANYVALDDSTVVAGSGADFITVATKETTTVTLGGGADVFEVVVASTESTVTDFVAGTDTILLSGTTTKELDLSKANTPTKGAYTVSADFIVTLTGSTTTDISNIFQLGDSKNAFVAVTAKATVGGDKADWITTAAAGAVTVTGGGGADVILLGAKADTDVVVVAAGESTITAYDKIGSVTDAVAANTFDVATKLDLDSTNIATVIGTTAVGGFTGITVNAAGLITAWQGNTLTLDTLDEALAFLAANVGSTDTVIFNFTHDINGDGDGTDANVGGVATQDEYVSTFVFQSGATDTVIELVGYTGTGINDGSAAEILII